MNPIGSGEALRLLSKLPLSMSHRRTFLDAIVRWFIITGGISVLFVVLLLVIFLMANGLPFPNTPDPQPQPQPLETQWLPPSPTWYQTDASAGLRQILTVQDGARSLWKGGRWQLNASPLKVRIDYEYAPDSVTGKKRSIMGSTQELESPFIAACALAPYGRIMTMKEGGQLEQWEWLGNQAFPGKWQARNTQYWGAWIDLIDAVQLEKTQRATGLKMACHPEKPWVLIWNHQRWWLWSLQTEQVEAFHALSGPGVMGFGQQKDKLNLMIGWESLNTVKANGDFSPAQQWSLEGIGSHLLSWKQLIEPSQVIGADQPQQRWAPDNAQSHPFEHYNVLPLLEGTVKVALLALFLATPLALSAAVYSSHFMSPSLRGKVKPMIELIEAVPSVVLGFIAIMAFGPWLEYHLFGFLWVLGVLPLVFVFSGFAWANLPQSWRRQLPEGWEMLAVFPVLIIGIYALFHLGEWIEMRLWPNGFVYTLDQSYGVDYQNRNALLTSLAMGIALIPTLYSIAEDALYTVPQTVRDGSLALGATPWQTLIKVILPMASPGIFAALMIGFGRALGETMIVLMASGNSATTHWNIFEGLRSLAATLALEMPAAGLYSTHYHLLFLLAFLLFVFTFLVNSGAEYIRYRLRARFGGQA